jgi:protein-tyrosine phosphatase
MVCLGNICRSPLAEGIMKQKLKQYGINAEVDSAGTAAYHVGEKPDPRSIQVALKNGIDITYQRARKFMKADFDHFDKIFAMDSFNYNDLLEKAQTEDDKEKVMMILEKTHPGMYKSVPDPYYGGVDGFDKVFTMLDNACEIIAKELLKDETSMSYQTQTKKK